MRVLTPTMIFLGALIPGLVHAQDAPPEPRAVSTQTELADAATDEELRELRREVVELRMRLDEQQSGPVFESAPAVLTFFLTTAAVSVSYAAADAKHGEATRKLMPDLTSAKVVGYGTLLAAGPGIVAGLGAGFDSPALMSAGITMDILLALVPWGVGALATGITSSKYYRAAEPYLDYM